MAARVRGARAYRGYSQLRLSALTGLSRQYLSELEQGKRPRPRGETLERLATALGFTPAQLRGCQPLPDVVRDSQAQADAEAEVAALEGETVTANQESAAQEATPERTSAVRPDLLRGVGALGLTSLLTLPPGTTLMQKLNPDGSMLLYVRIPAGPPKAHKDHHANDHPDATPPAYNGDETTPS